jgi:hypothetical protein
LEKNVTEFTFHTEDSAPEASKALLAGSMKSFGMIPGLHAVMAEALLLSGWLIELL